MAEVIDRSREKHTSVSLLETLIPVQKEKHAKRINDDKLRSREISLLTTIRELVTEKNVGTMGMPYVEKLNGCVDIKAMDFYGRITDRMKRMQQLENFKIVDRSIVDSLLYGNQIWETGEGVNDQGYLTISRDKLTRAIDRLTKS
jgi:hypothetical protein